MTRFHHRRLPEHSTLLIGPTPRDETGYVSEKFQIWFNHTDESWVKEAERPHMHTHSEECFIVLNGSLVVDVEGEQIEIGPREFCCFSPGVYHAIVEVRPPAETLMIRAPSIEDKIVRL